MKTSYVVNLPWLFDVTKNEDGEVVEVKPCPAEALTPQFQKMHEKIFKRTCDIIRLEVTENGEYWF